jgi:spore germination protein YaaH
MLKKVIISLLGLIAGILIGLVAINFYSPNPLHVKKVVPKQIIGFLPYWQLDKTNSNTIGKLTTLTYFGLSVNGDGHIVKLTNNDTQEEPGWYQLHSDKLTSYFATARKNNVKLSLLISSGDGNAINHMVSKPDLHAETLVKEITPLMKKYHFTDLNLDIEDTTHASSAAQKNFTEFVKTVKRQLDTQKLGTLTVEISPTDVINYNLINVAAITPYADTIILMAYDYHSPDSIVTGPVAPLGGAGIDSEYDVATAVERSLQSVPPEKLLLGMPLYGYEWETLNSAVRSAIIPGSGVLASNNRIETSLANCSSCNAFYENESQEEFIVYRDKTSGTYHQISVPGQQSLTAKITYANKKLLGGVALWALGYESQSMLTPLANYK